MTFHLFFFYYYYFFSEKIRYRQKIYMKCKALFSLKNEIKMLSAAVLFVWIVYDLVNTVKVTSSWSVNLLTFFPVRLCPLRDKPVLVHILLPVTDNAFLESAEGREWQQKWFHDHAITTKSVRAGIGIRNPWITTDSAMEPGCCCTFVISTLWNKYDKAGFEV